MITTLASRAAAAERLGGRPRDRLGEVEVGVILGLAEVLGAEQLGQADETSAPSRAASLHASDGAREVVGGIRRAAHLHEADLELLREPPRRLLLHEVEDVAEQPIPDRVGRSS